MSDLPPLFWALIIYAVVESLLDLTKKAPLWVLRQFLGAARRFLFQHLDPAGMAALLARCCPRAAIQRRRYWPFGSACHSCSSVFSNGRFSVAPPGGRG